MNLEKQDIRPESKSPVPVSSLTRLIHEQQDKEKSQSKSNLSLKFQESGTSNPNKELNSNIPTVTDHSPVNDSYEKSMLSTDNTSNFDDLAPPIKPPTSPREIRNRSSSNASFMMGESLSSSIPYSVPGGRGHNSSISHSMNTSASFSHIPNLVNGQPIQSIHIQSPQVNSSSIEPRFIISKQRVAQAHAAAANAASMSTPSQRSGSSHSNLSYFFSKSKPKSSSTDLGSFYNNSYQTGNMVISNDNSIAGSPTSVSSLESKTSITMTNRHNSMVNLKRFFKKPSITSPPQSVPVSNLSASLRSANNNGNTNNSTNSNFINPDSLPGSASSSLPSSPMITSGFQLGASTSRPNFEKEKILAVSNIISPNPQSQQQQPQVPFSKRYSKFGENLGAGAGGSVRLVSRLSDKKVFAVKEFRNKYQHESKRDYAKKITGEYCIGSTLRHPNIIETVEICYENERILQVMEYCDFDLFAIVMSNKMSREEISCCFKQILSGINYLHSIGLAHRDLKLDNCVVDTRGVVKLIDFGSSVVFSYPFTKTLIEAQGIVGSDPYLAPEVCVFNKYDPRPVDVWSAAIIFCCMMLKKFPWKVPKLTDNSFKLFSTREGNLPLNELLKQTPVPPSYIDATTPGPLNNFDDITKSLNDMDSSSHNSQNSPSSSNQTSPPSSRPQQLQNDSNQTITEASSVKMVGPTPAASDSTGTSQTDKDGKPHTSSLTGAIRLLHALPEDCRPLIGRMVELAPACRISIEEVMNDKWLQSVPMCTVEEHLDGHGMAHTAVVKASNHEHTLVDQSEAHIAGLERKKNKK